VNTVAEWLDCSLGEKEVKQVEGNLGGGGGDSIFKRKFGGWKLLCSGHKCCLFWKAFLCVQMTNSGVGKAHLDCNLL
jgi:hypothetical protein